MSRTLPERMKDWRWWGEQVLHFAIGWLLVWLFIKIGVHTSVAVGLSSFAGGVREVAQNWGDEDGSLGDSLVDLFAWVAGAVAAGL